MLYAQVGGLGTQPGGPLLPLGGPGGYSSAAGVRAYSPSVRIVAPLYCLLTLYSWSAFCSPPSIMTAHRRSSTSPSASSLYLPHLNVYRVHACDVLTAQPDQFVRNVILLDDPTLCCLPHAPTTWLCHTPDGTVSIHRMHASIPLTAGHTYQQASSTDTCKLTLCVQVGGLLGQPGGPPLLPGYVSGYNAAAGVRDHSLRMHCDIVLLVSYVCLPTRSVLVLARTRQILLNMLHVYRGRMRSFHACMSCIESGPSTSWSTDSSSILCRQVGVQPGQPGGAYFQAGGLGAYNLAAGVSHHVMHTNCNAVQHAVYFCLVDCTGTAAFKCTHLLTQERELCAILGLIC
jgi:hypothetical protein